MTMVDDADFMQRALALARHAAGEGEVPIGALVAADGRVLGEGWNRPVTARDPSAHAEIEALRAAARAADGYRLPGATLYVTLEPCPMCVGALIHARVARVVYGAPDPKTGACGGALALHAHPSHNHHPRVEGGVMAEACAEVLRGFFRRRRRARRPAVRLLRLGPEEARAYTELEVRDDQSEFVSPAPLLIRRHFQDGYGEALYGVEADGRAAGLMMLLPPEQGVEYAGCRGDEAWLEGFRIDRRYQGCGVAAKALAAVCAAAARRYAWLSLTVNRRNDRAEAAYRRFGFRDTGAVYHGGPAGSQRILSLDLAAWQDAGPGP